MKTALTNLQPARPSEGGFAVLVVLAFLAIMVVLVGANVRSVNWLRREVKLVEKQQVDRLMRLAGHPPPARRATLDGPSALTPGPGTRRPSISQRSTARRSGPSEAFATMASLNPAP
jgi:hypothetical protein